MNYYKKYTPYLFLLPAAAVLIVFFFIPFFQTFGLSFFDYSSSIYHPTFNGLDNYAKLFKEPIFYKVMFNTFMYLVIAVPFLVTFPLFLAILINQKIRGITLYKILLYLPVIVSIVVAAIAFKWLYAGQGILNYALSLINIPPINWLVDTHWALFSVAVVTIWKGIGYYMMIYDDLSCIANERSPRTLRSLRYRWCKLHNQTPDRYNPAYYAHNCTSFNNQHNIRNESFR